MHPTEYENMARHERTHWWFAGKRRLISHCLAQYGPPATPTGRIVDVGCGSGGGTLAMLRTFSPFVTGFDVSAQALTYIQPRPGIHLGQADISHLPLVEDSVDCVIVSNILYHQWIPNDEAALGEVYRILKPGGLLILTEPAFSFLAGPHDKINMTARRYTVPHMHHKLRRLGFSLQKESYLYALLMPIAFLQRWVQRLLAKSNLPTSDIRPLPPWLNTTLLYLYSLELAWLRIGRLPWGTSILMVARKPHLTST